MNEERKKILEMLSEGKITAEDAERLLDKIESAAQSAKAEPGEKKTAKSGKIKWLLINVDSTDGDTVNIRVPINLIRTGIKLGAILPEGATEKIHEAGIDLSDLHKLADEELVEALADLQVDVNSEDGDTVRIYCE